MKKKEPMNNHSQTLKRFSKFQQDLKGQSPRNREFKVVQCHRIPLGN